MVVGIDEVGRGCWAGPLVAGAVCLDSPVAGLADSKVLTKLARRRLSELVKVNGSVGLGWVWPGEIDDIGLTAAVRLAMERALANLNSAYDQVIIDGNYNFLNHINGTSALIKADATVPAVSAASIVAKVARDDYMANLPVKYAGYGFASHVGYGTAAHRAALEQLGVSDIHRRSFKPIKSLLE